MILDIKAEGLKRAYLDGIHEHPGDPTPDITRRMWAQMFEVLDQLKETTPESAASKFETDGDLFWVKLAIGWIVFRFGDQAIDVGFTGSRPPEPGSSASCFAQDR